MIDYEILYPGAFPVVRFKLRRDERIKAESDAMVGMSPTIEVEGSLEGGLMGGLARKILTGESFFFQNLIAKRGSGEVILGHSIPGGIMDVVMDGTESLKVQKGGFLAATEGINVGTKMQGIGKGLFSREGFFILDISGEGVVFISSYGSIHLIKLTEGEQYIVDNGHMVAWSGNMKYSIEKASKGWISSVTSGEGFVCRFTGPGLLFIQTRAPLAFRDWCNLLGVGRGAGSRR